MTLTYIGSVYTYIQIPCLTGIQISHTVVSPTLCLHGLSPELMDLFKSTALT